MNIFQKLLKKLQLKFFPNKIQKEVKRWYRDGGDYKLRFNYCLDNKSVVFDLGGYEGQYASDLFSRMPCNIYIFEPVIEYAKAIEDRYKNNKMIKSFPFGLSDKNQKIKIAKIGDASSVFRSNSSKNLQSIMLKDIVEFMNEKSIKNLDLIKINIEGGEYQVLNRLIGTNLIKNIKNILVQFHDIDSSSKSERDLIRNKLKKTHNCKYCYEFVWENWVIKDQINSK